MELKCIQIYPIGDQDIAELQRFIKNKTGIDTNYIQIEQASFDMRVGYVAFPKDVAETAVRRLDRTDFNDHEIRARIVNLTDDSPGIPVRPNGARQNSAEDPNSRYYPGQSPQNGPPEIRRPSNSNRRSYQQQSEDPRNFGLISPQHDFQMPEDNLPPNYGRQPQPSGQIPPQFQPMANEIDQGRDMERRSKESKHKKRRRSSYSSDSSSDSSDSAKQSKHKHKHHHHHHHKSKKET